jgi:DNA polymerase I-like protein with 3'-5' exonuclease and polymerase domains
MRYAAVDIEAVGLHPYGGTIWMIAMSYQGKKWVEHNCNGLTSFSMKTKSILNDDTICKVIHSAEYDIPYIELNEGSQIRNVWDTRLCEVVIQGTQIPRGSKDEELKAEHSSSLAYTLPRYGFDTLDKTIRENFINRPKGKKFTKAEIDYAYGDIDDLLELQQAQEYVLTRDGLLEVALLENAVAVIVAKMRVLGLGLDKKLWLEIADQNLYNYKRLIGNLPKDVSNWNSPKQVKEYFKDRGIFIPTFEKLDEILRETNDPILKKFIEARGLYSFATAYGQKFLFSDKTGRCYIDSDGRVRTSWEQIINTGRFASAEPNLLAIPKEGDQRAAFIPARGCCFVIGDFSGQEIGVMAAASNEDLWIDAGLRGDDIHSLTASLLFSSEWIDGTKRDCSFPSKCKCPVHIKLRDKSKAINFMMAYGGGPNKYMEKTGVTLFEAKVTIAKFKRVVRKLTRWLEQNGKRAVREGVTYSADPYKRRFLLKGMEDWQIENQGKNYPVQGPGANMLKLSMISIDKKYPIVHTWHDEIILEVKIKDGKKAAKELKTVMEQSADYITGIKGLIKVEPRIAYNLIKE